MGDSSTCLMQPFSYTVLPPAEDIQETFLQDNPIHALGQSVSFGRFASESLSWEKWSTFSHKRYVEEAEKYSRPGSVAEKKAFFEAHYKRMAEKKKAEAALLEQANAASGDAPGSDGVSDDYNSALASVDLENVGEPKEEAWAQVRDSDLGFLLDMDKLQCKEDDDKEPRKEQTETRDVERSPLKTLVHKSKEDNFSTPKREATARHSLDKKRSAHKWLKPLNFTPVKELNLLSSAVKRKIDNSRLNGDRPEASKDCSTPIKTPTVPKGSSALATPQSEQRPMENDTPAGSKMSIKRRSLATECSKFLNACKNKLQSPKISTPFRLRTEERAARRRQKLEDKFNEEKAQTLLPKTKLKEIAETEPRKWRPTFCFTGPLPGEHTEIRRAEDPMKKIPTHRPQPRKPGTGAAQNTPVPIPSSQTSTTKSNGAKRFLGKSFQTASRPQAAGNITTPQENTPPNIRPA